MGYEILATNGDYRLVSDPEHLWHIQCISTGAWYTEASGGWADDSQTRGKYLELVERYFPEFQDEEPRCPECDAVMEDEGAECEWCAEED